MSQKNQILDKATANRKLLRMAYEIYERNFDAGEIILVGIKESGYNMASILKKKLSKISNLNIELVGLELNKKQVSDIRLSKALNCTNKAVVLVDDVANSGKTLLYSLEPLMQQHPATIQIAVLVNRMHKAFPVTPDYTGLHIATTLQEHIVVESSKDEIEGAYLI